MKKYFDLNKKFEIKREVKLSSLTVNEMLEIRGGSVPPDLLK